MMLLLRGWRMEKTELNLRDQNEVLILTDARKKRNTLVKMIDAVSYKGLKIVVIESIDY